MKIVDIAIGVIANPYSEMVTAGVKGGKAAHDIVFIEIKTDAATYGYQELCRALEIPIAAVESTPGELFGTTQYLAQRAADIVRSDVSWRAA